MADQAKVLIPPNSKESEMMVLGSMLTSINSLNAAADCLNASDFYHSEHQIIFDVLKAAYTNDKPADVHLVCEELKRQDKLKSVGGVAYVTSLAQYAGTSAFIEEYAEIVQNKAILRRMIHAAHDIERNAAADPSDVHALLDEAQQKFFTISQASNSQGGVLVRDLLSGVKATAKIPFLKELQQRQEEFQLKGPQDIAITGLPSHFIDLDKMINGLGNSNFILLAARPAMGKCVSGDTQILNPLTGALNSIKDFVTKKMDQILTLNEDWTLSNTSPSAFVADGIKPTFQVTTALGKEIEATAVHPLLTISGWKRVEELKVGDHIASPRTLPYFGTKKWAESKLIELANFIAYGHALNTLANTGATSPLSPPAILEEESSSFSEAETDWLGSLELKTLPKEIFELTKVNLSILLNRLFSCGGRALLANCDGDPFPAVKFASDSKKLIYQIQHLLLRFGIISKICKKDTSSFELEIHAHDSLSIFCKEIGIFGKEDAISEVLNYILSTSPEPRKDTIPLEIWDRILAKKGSRTWDSLFQAKGLTAPSHLHEGEKAPCRDTLAKLADVLKDLELKQIAESDVYWDRITSIVSTGEKEVFDLTIDHTHNFVAGDIIVHNTAFAVNIAENICFKSGLPVGIFSLEMTSEQLLHRLICSQAEIESDKLRNGNLSGAEFQRIVAAVSSMQKSTMVIDDQPGLKITDLRARARRMKETHGIRFLVIDYLQLISGSGVSRSAENRQNEISEISRMLKNLARELNIPIVCLSQLSRKVEERPGHRPMMSDLRESGSLEQDSDVVVFLLRREYYDPYDKPGQAEVIVAKNRHGGVGSVFLTFRKELAQFANYSASLDSQPPNDEAFSAFTAR